MKHLLLLLLLTCLGFNCVQAQLVVEAGNDIYRCSNWPVSLGGFPTAQGGQLPYTYAWMRALNPTIISTAPNPILNDTFSGPTTYTVTVTDAAGSTATDNVTVYTLTASSVYPQATSITFCIGDTLKLLGQNPQNMPNTPWLWMLPNEDTLQQQDIIIPNARPLDADTYQFLVCWRPVDVIVTASSCNKFYYNPTKVSCYGSCDGKATIVAPDQQQYYYNWSTGNTGKAATNLCAGTYSCTITNDLGLPVDTLFIDIEQPSSPLTIYDGVIQVGCTGVNSGRMYVLVQGGYGDYRYKWSNNATFYQISQISSGTYSVTITDKGNCSVSGAYTINQPIPLALNTDTIGNPDCNTCTGMVTVHTVGGAPPYTYNWNSIGNTFSGDSVIGNLCTGSVRVTVTDANNCRRNTNALIHSNKPALTYSITNTHISCSNAVDTTVITFTSGTPPYTINWGDGTPQVTTSSPARHTYTSTSTYTIYVTDSFPCTAAISNTIKNVNSLKVSTLQLVHPACKGTASGKIKIKALGGQSPYTYLWNTGATTDTIANIPAGTYSVTVTDAAMCDSVFSFTLNYLVAPSGYYTFLTGNNLNCNETVSSISSVTTGGYPPYTYLWNTVPPQTGAVATGLANGNYVLTVTDAMGCTKTGKLNLLRIFYNVIKGVAYFDANGNCSYDNGETLAKNMKVEFKGTDNYYATTDSAGRYSILIPHQGTYQLQTLFDVSASCYREACLPTLSPIVFNSTCDTVNYNIGVVPSAQNNLAVRAVWTNATPGMEKKYTFCYYRKTPQPFTNTAIMTFKYDSNLIFNYTYPLGYMHDIATHTLTWQINNMPYNISTTGPVVYAFFTVPANTPVNYMLKSNVRLDPFVDDCDTSDNYLNVISPVAGSYDPNIKTVEPSGIITEDDSILTYTIHFQNTGNDTTWFVIIKDTLPHLEVDPGSVRNIASSHPYSNFDLSGRGILTWTFNPVYLVDSATNEEASKGFVMFSVKKRSGLAPGTVISNKASIYFDYNDPIVTNAANDTMAFSTYIFSPLGNNDIIVSAYPNPFSDHTQIVVEGTNSPFMFELYDMAGRIRMQMQSNNPRTLLMPRGTLAAGIYLYRINTGDKYGYGKLVVE